MSSSGKMVPPDGGWGWVVAFGGFLLTCVVGGVNCSYGVFYLEVLDRFGSSSALSAWLGGIQSFFRLALSPFAAALCSRFGVQRVVMAGGFLFGSGLFLSAWASSLWQLYLTYGVLTGLGGTLVYTPAYIIIAQYFERRLGVALSLMSCGAGAGNFFWPPLLHISLERLSYFETMATFSGVAFHLVAIGALFFTLPDVEKEGGAHEGLDTPKEKGKVGTKSVMAGTCLKHFNLMVLRDPDALLFYFAVFMYMFGGFSFSSLIVAFARDRGVSAHLAPLLLSVEGLSQFGTRFSSGFLFDHARLRPYRMQTWSVAFLIVAVVALLAVFCRGFFAFAVLAFTFASCKGLIIAQMVTVLRDLVPKELLGAAIGYCGLSRGLGVVMGALLCGYLKDLSGSYVLSYLAMSGIVLVASATLGLLNFRVLRKKKAALRSENLSLAN